MRLPKALPAWMDLGDMVGLAGAAAAVSGVVYRWGWDVAGIVFGGLMTLLWIARGVRAGGA